MANIYTAFCQQSDGTGTIHIDTIAADDLEDAKVKAKQNTANDWDYSPDQVHVLGIAEGNVSLAFWEDL